MFGAQPGWDGNRAFASDLTSAWCGWNNIEALEGIENFTGLRDLESGGIDLRVLNR